MNRAATALLAILLSAAPAAAEVAVDLRYGHGGRAVAGALTPIRLRVTNREAEPVSVTFSTRPGRAAPDVSFAQTHLAPGTTKDLFLLHRPVTWLGPWLEVAFDRPVRVARGREITSDAVAKLELDVPQRDHVLPSVGFHILAVGPSAAALPDANLGEILAVLPVEESDLPAHPFAYDGIDVVYWRNPGETAPPDPDVVRALMRWTALGGRLVVSATRRPEVLHESGLDRILAAVPGAPVPDSDYAAVLRPLRSGPKLPALPPGPVTPLPDPTAFPYLTRIVGFGSTTVLSFDPARIAEVRDPDLAGALMAVILGVPGTPPGMVLVRSAQSLAEDVHISGSSPPGRLVRELRDGTAPSTPVGLLMVFLFLYVVAIGPADYVVLKRMRRLQYSALSLILLAVAFSTVAFVAAFVIFAGGREVRRVTVVDVTPDPAAEGVDLVLIQDYAAVYAPRGGDFDFAPSGIATAVDRLVDPASYDSGGFGAGALGGGLVTDFGSPLAPRTTLEVPFRAARYVRSLHLRSEPFPISCRLNRGTDVTVTNGLPFALSGARLVGTGLLLPCADVPAGRDTSFPWVAMSAEKFIALPAAQALFAPIGIDPRDPVDVGHGLVSLSIAAAADDESSSIFRAERRTNKRFGLERPERLAAGEWIFAACTDAPDPLGLPLADIEGHTVTVFRKAIEP